MEFLGLVLRNLEVFLMGTHHEMGVVKRFQPASFLVHMIGTGPLGVGVQLIDG